MYHAQRAKIFMYKILVRKFERKRQLGVSRRIFGDNIRMVLREIYWKPSGCIKYGNFFITE